MPRQLIGNINKQQQTKQPSMQDSLLGAGKNIVGMGANTLPIIGNVLGSDIGGGIGKVGGAIAGAAVPGAGETGVSEAVGGVAGGVAGRAGGGAVGQDAGEMLKEYVRQNLLGLDKPNPLQNKKEQQMALEEGGVYGLVPFGNGSKGMLGLLKHAVAGGGANGAAQAIENLNNGKPAGDNVGWQSALGAITNGVLGGAFDRNYETAQLTKDGQPKDFFQQAKTNPEQFSAALKDHIAELRKTGDALVKQEQYEAKQTEDKLQSLFEGKTAPANTIIKDIESIAQSHNFNFLTSSKNKQVHGAIDQIKQFLVDAADKGSKPIENETGDPFVSSHDQAGVMKSGDNYNTKYVRDASGELKPVSGRAVQNEPLTAVPPSTTKVPRVQTIEQIKANQKLDVATVNKAKRLITENNLYDSHPVFKAIYGKLQKFVEEGSGNSEQVKQLNQDLHNSAIAIAGHRQNFEKLAEDKVKAATKELVDKGSTTGLAKVQTALRLVGMSIGYMFGRRIGHPYIGSGLGGQAGGALGQSAGVATILKALNNQTVQHVMQQGELRGVKSTGNMGNQQNPTGY